MDMGKVAVLAAAALALSGCANQRDVLQVAAPGPDARRCDAAVERQGELVDVFQDTRRTRLVASNDGGWCGSYVQLIQYNRPVGWMTGALYEPPEHGAVRLRTEGSVVHVEYRADPGHVGADAFAVQLQPGWSIRRTSVQAVASGSGAARPRSEIGVTSSLGEDNRGRAPQR